MRLTGILLAAGKSERYGSDKRFAMLPNGKTVLETCAATFIRAQPDAIAVLRPQDPKAAQLLTAMGYQICHNTQADAGMGDSLAHGISHSRDSEGWLIMPADLPWVQMESIHTVAASLESPRGIVVPTYDNQRGHPVGFGAFWGDALASISGPLGGRELIRKHPAAVTWLALKDSGINKDIDIPATPEKH